MVTRLVAAAVVGVLLAGCDYTVPLVATPAMATDGKLVGVWERTNEEGRPERLLVLPLSDREYLVSYPAGTPDSLFAKACLGSCAGRTFVQIQWVGTAKGAAADTNRVYQLAAYEVEGGELRVRLVNSAVVSKDVATTAELVKAIETNRDRANLLGDRLVFKRAQ